MTTQEAIRLLKAECSERRRQLVALEQVVAAAERGVLPMHAKRRFASVALGHAAYQVLKEQGHPMTVKEIADALLEGGYTSAAGNFRGVVATRLGSWVVFEKLEDGRWHVKPDAQPPQGFQRYAGRLQ